MCLQNLELQKEIAKRKGYADPQSLLTAIRNLCKKDSEEQVAKKNLRNLQKCAHRYMGKEAFSQLVASLKLKSRLQALNDLQPVASKGKQDPQQALKAKKKKDNKNKKMSAAKKQNKHSLKDELKNQVNSSSEEDYQRQERESAATFCRPTFC